MQTGVTKTMKKCFGNLASIMSLALVLTACAQTQYVGFEDADEPNPISPIRTVMVEIDEDFYDEFPDCVVVMRPAAAENLDRFPKLVEASLALYLTRKISRVVGGVERDLLARNMAIDLVHPGDREAFMEALDCDAFVTAEVLGPGHLYLFVWSQVRIGLEVRMTRYRDQRVLWRARHIADRSEGGLPLSPLSAILDGYSSAQFSADKEIIDSVVDDAVRRIVASLPNAIALRR